MLVQVDSLSQTLIGLIGLILACSQDKARSAITKYGMDAVVANELHSRYEEVPSNLNRFFSTYQVEKYKLQVSTGIEVTVHD